MCSIKSRNIKNDQKMHLSKSRNKKNDRKCVRVNRETEKM